MQRERQRRRVAALRSRAARQSWKCPVLRPRSLGGLPSRVQRQQILLVARDQFRIAVAAADLIVAHGSPIAGGGQACAARQSASGNAGSPPRSRPAPCRAVCRRRSPRGQGRSATATPLAVRPLSRAGGRASAARVSTRARTALGLLRLQNRLEDGFLLLWWDGWGVTKLCFPQSTDKGNKF